VSVNSNSARTTAKTVYKQPATASK